MQFPLYLIALCSAIAGVYARFDPAADSCTPANDAFKGNQSPNLHVCVADRPSGHTVTYTCGPGKVIYDFQANTIKLVKTFSMEDSQFTIHGACYEKTRQVAHIDLYMATKGLQKTEHTYWGLNRICKIGGITSLKLYSYTLNQDQIAQCGFNEVTPIS